MGEGLAWGCWVGLGQVFGLSRVASGLRRGGLGSLKGGLGLI